MEAVLFTSISAFVWLCPFTKVEESFAMQATNDVLKHFFSLESLFPGVVPRTFIGPLFLAFASSPTYFALNAFERFLPGSTNVHLLEQIAVRLTLGLLSSLAAMHVRRAISRRFGESVSYVFVVLTAVQFHLPFYMSRTLPNTFALVLVMHALAFHLNEHYRRCLWTLAFCCVVVRCDIVLFAGPLVLTMAFSSRLSLSRIILHGLLAGVVSLATTVAVDSIFWGRLLWPEGMVLFFNTVQNKSHEWGTLPFYWYFIVALPKMLLGGLPFAFYGAFVDMRIRTLGLVSFTFVTLYSFLPHKEARFIFPAVIVFNICAAYGMVYLYQRKRKSFVYQIASAAVPLALIGTLAVSLGFFLRASYYNYPGGEAFMHLHSMAQPMVPECKVATGSFSLTGRSAPPAAGCPEVWVHIDPPAAMSGITRFLEHPLPWRYSKEERHELPLKEYNYDYLITAKPEVDGFELMHTQLGFDRLRLREVQLKPTIYVHKRSRNTSI